MAAEQPKKPVAGAYGRFLSAKRAEVAASLPQGHKSSDIAKKTSELWKTTSASEKEKYEKLFKAAQEAYVAATVKFKAEGGVITRKSKKDKDKKIKKKKDANAPKKPVAGAYGCYLTEKRAEIVASLPAGYKPTAVSKKASELWKAVPDSEKSRYDKLYKDAVAAYNKAMLEYKANLGAGSGGEDEEQAASPVAKAGRKRKAGSPEVSATKTPVAKAGRKRKAASPEVSEAKKSKGGDGKAGKRTVEQPAGIPIGDTVLAAAAKGGFESQLKNLAGRGDLVASGKSDRDLLKALTDSGGLVNPAKRALLGA